MVSNGQSIPVRKHSEANDTVQARIPGVVNFTHAAGPSELHSINGVITNCPRRFIPEPHRLISATEHRRHPSRPSRPL